MLTRLLCFVIITLVICELAEGHGNRKPSKHGYQTKCDKSGITRNIGSKKFCRSLLNQDGVLEGCSKHFKKHYNKATLDWCEKLYRRYGGKAECEILQVFVDKCHGYDGHRNITETSWRTEQDCPKQGVLITTPNMWSAGLSGQVCVGFHNIHVPTSVHVSIMDNGKKVASMTAIMSSSGCVKVSAPLTCATTKHELVVCVSNAFYTYSSPKEPTFIKCSQRGSITFIQTDKPIYKPGQNVRFRVLTVLLPNLTPEIANIERVYMETPGATRVLQKDDVGTRLGLAEFEFQLDTHPPLGTWTIFVMNSAGKHTKQFKVDEFVLPKWDVTIQAPELVLVEQEASFKICAFYTYGEAVPSTYTVSVSTTNWSPNSVIDTVKFSGSMDNSGCITISADGSDLEGFGAYKYLRAEASVTETLTGVTREATSDRVRILRGDFQMEFHSRMSRFYKPGGPVFGQVSVKSPTGPMVGVDVLLKLEKEEQTRRTDKDGTVEFVFPPSSIPKGQSNSDIKVSINDTSISRHLQGWYSESKMYVLVVPPYEETIPCVGDYSFPVYHNALPGTTFNYILISKGHVVLTGSIEVPQSTTYIDCENVGFLKLLIPISPMMSGRTTMVVYYVRDDLEFIADFISFDVDQCFKNEVEFSFNKDKGEPGENVTYTLSAATDSLCGIGVIDKSLEILAGNSFILRDQVFKLLDQLNLRFTSNQFGTTEYCREKLGDDDDKVTSPPKPIVGAEKDEAAEKKDAPPLQLERPQFFGGDCKPYMHYWSKFVDSSQALNSLGVFAMSDLELQTRPCIKEIITYCHRFFEAQPDMAEDNAEGDAEEVDIRSFFPETFLWKLVVIPCGSVTEQTILPDTITEWYGNAVCTNKDVGMGISDFASIITFQTFFIQLGLPYSIIRGETVHIPVLLFNYLEKGECVAVKITLSAQDTFDMEGAAEYTVCSCGQLSTSVEFTITPNKLGHIEITVVAVTVSDTDVCEGSLSSTKASDGVTRQLLVKPEGIEQSYSFSRFLCANASISTDLPLPDHFVSGSERGRVSVIGDVMGPALSNLDGLIRMPMGCGEQTIYFTGQAAIVYKYLVTIGQNTAAIETKALSSMNSGYQRELTFKHSNGAYSVWGPNGWGGSEGSNWLTAFVVRVFALSDEFIFIDPHEQAASIAYLQQGQGTDGCFPQFGTVVHSNMQGGLQGSAQPIALTAFILVSLLEAGATPTDTPVVSAIGCLDNANPADMSTYALALSAYAYTLYGQDSARRQDLIDELNTRAVIEDGQKHWTAAAVAPPSTNWWQTNPPSFDVEMTAYVLLALVTPGGTSAVGDGLPIVRWLTSKRNAFGGWSSTQDTFVGLQALSKYAMLIVSDVLDLDVNITPPGVTFHVDASNMQVLQSENVDVPTDIDIKMTGTGCAIVQADVWYNIIPPIPVKPFFTIVVTVTPTRQCERKTLEICVTYNGADTPTNMALVQVKLVTGWSTDSLPIAAGPGIREENSSGVITKIEVVEDTATFYFDELTSTTSCFKLGVIQDVKVNNVKAGHVTVLDYYETDKTNSIEYTLMCA